MREYAGFAELYDDFMDDHDYGAWAEYLLALLAERTAAGGRVIDAGCGTGGLSASIAAAGYDVIGLDRSERMLEIASAKARAAGVRLRPLRQDMRDMRLGRVADAIISTCDAVNYLLTLSDVSSFLRCCKRCLKPGGALLFDVRSPRALEATHGQLYFDDRDDMACFWDNCFDAERRILTMSVTLFAKRKSGLFERFREEHLLRAHEACEILPLLDTNGFDAEVCGFMNRSAPTGDEDRLQFVAVRR